MSPKSKPLTDEQYAAIAWADPSESTAALARRLDAPYQVVYDTRQRMAQQGGWLCPLVLSRCAVCGEPLLYNAATKPRLVHDRCRRESKVTLNEAWRERHPEQVAATLRHWKAIARDEQLLTDARATNRGQRWTAAEDALILRQGDEPTREVALELGRSTGAVFARRVNLRRRAARTID